MSELTDKMAAVRKAVRLDGSDDLNPAAMLMGKLAGIAEDLDDNHPALAKLKEAATDLAAMAKTFEGTVEVPASLSITIDRSEDDEDVDPGVVTVQTGEATTPDGVSTNGVNQPAQERRATVPESLVPDPIGASGAPFTPTAGVAKGAQKAEPPQAKPAVEGTARRPWSVESPGHGGPFAKSDAEFVSG